jgi:hypothetical protein
VTRSWQLHDKDADINTAAGKVALELQENGPARVVEHLGLTTPISDKFADWSTAVTARRP